MIQNIPYGRDLETHLVPGISFKMLLNFLAIFTFHVGKVCISLNKKKRKKLRITIEEIKQNNY